MRRDLVPPKAGAILTALVRPPDLHAIPPDRVYPQLTKNSHRYDSYHY